MGAKETKLLWKEKKSIGNNTCRYVLNDHVSEFTSLSAGSLLFLQVAKNTSTRVRMLF